MPGGKTKFSNSWLTAVDSNKQSLSTWCRKGKDDFLAYCRLCDRETRCDNAGKAQLFQHAKKSKHLQAVKPVSDSFQTKLVATIWCNNPANSNTITTQSRSLSLFFPFFPILRIQTSYFPIFLFSWADVLLDTLYWVKNNS